ncbi:helix-turn-helix transcriptional regulator [Streptomyces sp. NPDC019396]|uniref:helix-turn-helix transcriptional regulator n=1 Tax=Streptomyces sp. NPDC019396 TaxID=3154687 RepID=UPI0033F6E80E
MDSGGGRVSGKRQAAANGLGDFLRARRAQLRPEDAGLPATGRRRVPGLRREEVALLAGVSADYYMRLEQGRERHPSPQVLDAVGRALRLGDPAVAHLHRLAVSGTRRASRTPRAEPLSPRLRRLIDGWTDTPAFVLGHSLDFLARNHVADALFAGFTVRGNLLSMVFLDPAAHDFFRDWDRAAASSVAALRQAAGTDADDPRLARLVDELCAGSREFRDLWDRHDVHGKDRETKRVRHPVVGDLDLHAEVFTVAGAPTQQLVVYQPEPGSPSACALTLLASLNAPPVTCPSPIGSMSGR